MSLIKKVALGAGALAVSAVAQAVVIDDWTVSQTVQDGTAGNGANTNSQAGPTANILGGNRDFSIDLLSSVVNPPPSPAQMTTGAVGPSSVLNFSTGTGLVANGIVQWDSTAGFAGAGRNGINATGLGGVDLTQGGNLLGIQALTYNADHPFTFAIAAFTSATQWSIVTLNAHTTPSFQIPPVPSLIPFAGFLGCGFSGGDVVSVVCGSGGAVNFASLGALELDVYGTENLDLTIGLVSSVPEPGVLGLIGASMFGLAFARRRSSRKQA